MTLILWMTRSETMPRMLVCWCIQNHRNAQKPVLHIKFNRSPICSSTSWSFSWCVAYPPLFVVDVRCACISPSASYSYQPYVMIIASLLNSVSLSLSFLLFHSLIRLWLHIIVIISRILHCNVDGWKQHISIRRRWLHKTETIRCSAEDEADKHRGHFRRQKWRKKKRKTSNTTEVK